MTEEEIKEAVTASQDDGALIWDNEIMKWILVDQINHKLIYSLFGYEGEYLLKLEENRYFKRKSCKNGRD